MIVAAEASSSLFAQRLLEHWQQQKKNIHAFGVGSDAMESLGFERLGKAEEMAVVGALEIIEHYGKLKAVFDRLVSEAKKRRPAVVIVMDYPEFNLMLAKKIHALGIPVVYYISPQVWVWRKGRVKTIKKYCQKVFTLFPFEVEFYKDKEVPVEFVGHPVLDEVEDKFYTDDYRRFHRNRVGIQDDETVIGLMPGSRRIELREHLPLQLEVARRLYKNYPRIKILIMVAPTFSKEQVQEAIGADFRLPFILLKDDPFEMIHLADYILAASGTATLQVGLMHKPMVIMYKTKWLTYWFFRRIVQRIKFVGLPNLILGQEVVPECLQVGADVLYEKMKRYLDEPQHSDWVRSELKKIQPQLGNKGATKRVAAALEEYLK
jgi:lipid-A-disaccharide synthase